AFQRRHHFRPDIAGKKLDDVAAGNARAFCGGFFRKKTVELIQRAFAALKEGPGIGVGIGRVDAANEIERETLLALIAVEGFKGARRKNPAKIPDNSLDHTVPHPAELRLGGNLHGAPESAKPPAPKRRRLSAPSSACLDDAVLPGGFEAGAGRLRCRLGSVARCADTIEDALVAKVSALDIERLPAKDRGMLLLQRGPGVLRA